MLIARNKYLNEILLFRDTDLIKVVTGVRRCGKSSLLKLLQMHLAKEGIPSANIVSLNLESKKSPVKTEDELYNYFKNEVQVQTSKNESGGLQDIGNATKRYYFFIDEVQRIAGWENAVNALRIDFDCDIYITGSNAYLLSSELSTYLSGRYVEIKMLPLAFSEYLDFCGIKTDPNSSIAVSNDGTPYSIEDLFERYLNFGGMPKLATMQTNQAVHSTYMSSLYNSIVTRDILHRERRKSDNKISNPLLLSRLCEYLADNVGNETSADSIAKALSLAGSSTSDKTVTSYIGALEDAYVFYRAQRYDLKGKSLLKTHPKYYIVDTGLRAALTGYKAHDSGRVFEGAVYLQLLYAGYSVHVGRLYQKEIDFVAIKDGRRVYIQVANTMQAQETFTREFAPLKAIRDSYEKMVVVRQGIYPRDVDGINILDIRKFFCAD